MRMNTMNTAFTGWLFFLMVTGWSEPGDNAVIQLKDSVAIHKYRLASGLLCLVKDKVITITAANGKPLFKNSTIIRKKDENGTCPSEGFLNIVSKGEYFTVEQQNCGGWCFVDEYITFKYLRKNEKIILYKFGLRYTDRSDPNKEIPEKVFDHKQFGTLYFEQVHIDSLYKYN